MWLQVRIGLLCCDEMFHRLDEFLDECTERSGR